MEEKPSQSATQAPVVPRDTANPEKPVKPKHTKYGILASNLVGTLRTENMDDKPGPERDPGKDSFAVTVVCYRLGEQGKIEFLAFVYSKVNGGVLNKTYRFPTETAEQTLDETPGGVALSCIKQEVLVCDPTSTAKIGEIVHTDIVVSDSPKKQEENHCVEILSPPVWYEAVELMSMMFQRGIKSHRKFLEKALRFLVNTLGNDSVNRRYLKVLEDWKGHIL